MRPHDPGPTDGLDHAVRDHGEEVVAGGVTEGVVDLLEPVDVDVEHAEGPEHRGQAQGMAEQGEDGVAVGEAGERVRRGPRGQLVLAGPFGGDVGDLGDEPTRAAVLVAHGADREVAPQDRAVDANEALLQSVGVAAPDEQLPLEGHVDAHVVGMGHLGEVHLAQLGLGSLQEGGHRRVHVDEAAAEVDQSHGDG
jgi:hypothetical protein